MTLRYLTLAAILAAAPTAFAQQVDNPPQTQTGQAGETSDRTPEKRTTTPQSQKDTTDGKTSDRSPDKNVDVQHQPGAAGTAGESSSEGASPGTSGGDKPASDK